jgi:hypothetical protein
MHPFDRSDGQPTDHSDADALFADEYSPTALTRNVRTKIIVCTCSCWVWTGSLDSSGYAKFKLRGVTVVAHRYVWDKFHPDRPLDGYDDTIDHSCDRHRACLNPAHMEPVTRSTNSVRANNRRWHGDDRDRSNCSVQAR